ncbi:MAG: hypothetical protein AAGE93_27610 [Bacteroidota bacterium]
MTRRLLFLLFSVSISSPSCEPETELGLTWLEIHVTENGEHKKPWGIWQRDFFLLSSAKRKY